MSNIEVILGPTNTGKTFYAFEQMFLYKNGAFGFPLRLLARENYDKACKKFPIDQIALITGEEKIIPKDAKYFFCTVESMPENNFEFICVDEIQLSNDYERGHIFTQKLLYFRGEYKTIFLGSLVMEKLIVELIPEAKLNFKNRFSELRYITHKKIQNIKPRSAIIAFNLTDLYEIAEQLRILKGGAALVVGALSPKTRNAQVKLYEDGEVDYIVATDAIGMGLNLDINQVYFSSLEKFDGKYLRPLNDIEIAQIAGRAGRYTKSGFFGSTHKARFHNKDVIDNVQFNKFEQTKKLFWRNHNLSFNSPYDLIRSLRVDPPNKKLILKKDASDQNFLMKFLGEFKNQFNINSSLKLKNLWDVCRIPDFQNISDQKHLMLLGNIYGELEKNNWKISENFLEKNIKKLEDYKGGINDLIYNLNETRTWLYITNHNRWITNENWRKVAEHIENRLSDEIHEGLLQKFVDKSQSAIVQNLNLSAKNITIDNNKFIHIKSEIIGKLDGFRINFYDKFKSVLNEHYKKIIIEQVSSQISMNIDSFIEAPDESIYLDYTENNTGIAQSINIKWGEDIIAQIVKGESLFRPQVKLIVDEKIIDSEMILKIQEKLTFWVKKNLIDKIDLNEDLLKINDTNEERTFIFSLIDKNYHFYKKSVLDDFKKIHETSRKKIHSLNFKLGKNVVYNSELLRPEWIKLKFYLWCIFYEKKYSVNQYVPKDGNATIQFNNTDEELHTFLGFYKELNILVRIDVFNEFEKTLFKRDIRGPFALPIDLSNLLGVKKEILIEILIARNMHILSISDNDQMVFKNSSNHSNKKIKNKNKIRKYSKVNIVKKNKPLFNNPFNDLEKFNVQ